MSGFMSAKFRGSTALVAAFSLSVPAVAPAQEVVERCAAGTVGISAGTARELDLPLSGAQQAALEGEAPAEGVTVSSFGGGRALCLTMAELEAMGVAEGDVVMAVEATPTEAEMTGEAEDAPVQLAQAGEEETRERPWLPGQSGEAAPGDDEAGAGEETDGEPEAEEAEPEEEAAPEAESEEEAAPEAEPEVVPEAESEDEAAPEAESEAAPEVEPEDEAAPEAESEAAPEVEPEDEAAPETESETAPEAEPEAMPETESEAAPETEEGAEPDAAGETETQAAPEAGAEAAQEEREAGEDTGEDAQDDAQDDRSRLERALEGLTGDDAGDATGADAGEAETEGAETEEVEGEEAEESRPPARPEEATGEEEAAPETAPETEATPNSAEERAGDQEDDGEENGAAEAEAEEPAGDAGDSGDEAADDEEPGLLERALEGVTGAGEEAADEAEDAGSEASGEAQGALEELAEEIEQRSAEEADPEAQAEIAEREAPEAAAAGEEDAAAAEVEEETVTEESARSSSEEFGSAFQTRAEARSDDDDDDDEGMSDLEKALLVGLGAVIVGQTLQGDDDAQVVSKSDDRVVVLEDGRYRVIRDDNALIERPGSTVRRETFDDGSTRTTVTREDGVQIVTIRDPELRVLRRMRVTSDGTRTLLIDDTAGYDPVDVAALPEALPEVEAETGEDALRAALEAEAGADRRFGLYQVRSIERVRKLAPAIDLDAINFRTGSAVIEPEEAQELADLGNLIRDFIDENPGEIFLVEGHTDAIGNAAYNLALSDRRAESVALALTEYFDVPPENLVVQGYGESDLKVKTLEAERVNRRAAVRRITPLLGTTGG